MTEAEQNRLVIEHMDLVSVIASDFRGGAIEFDDLCGHGREGLVKASRSYEPGKSKFSTWANICIRTEIYTAVRGHNQPSEWYPKEVAPPPMTGDKIEKIYEYDAWGDMGNAAAICETWSKLDTSPEDLSLLFADIKDKHEKFNAAFISLGGTQRKLVQLVFLRDPAMSIPRAASELGISRFQAGRMLRRALKIMREVIARMEANKKPSFAT